MKIIIPKGRTVQKKVLELTNFQLAIRRAKVVNASAIYSLVTISLFVNISAKSSAYGIEFTVSESIAKSVV